MTTTTYHQLPVSVWVQADKYHPLKQNWSQPRQFKQVMREVGLCIADGGRVSMSTYFVGNNEYADITLTWDTRRAKANRRRRSKRNRHK